MSLHMTRAEREAFLSGLHVGIISIGQTDAPPLAVPIWYDFDPPVGVWVITGTHSQKGRALAAAGSCSLVVQNETPPTYQYVSVSGPIIETRRAELEQDRRPMAHRYFGAELGDAYVASEPEGENSLYVMRPDTWRTVDYGKLGGAS